MGRTYPGAAVRATFGGGAANRKVGATHVTTPFRSEPNDRPDGQCSLPALCSPPSIREQKEERQQTQAEAGRPTGEPALEDDEGATGQTGFKGTRTHTQQLKTKESCEGQVNTEEKVFSFRGSERLTQMVRSSAAAARFAPRKQGGCPRRAMAPFPGPGEIGPAQEKDVHL